MRAQGNRLHMPERSSPLWPAAILAAYCILVLALLGHTPLWLDELPNGAWLAHQSESARHGSLAELLDWVLIDPGSAPLPFIARKLVVDWLGFSTWTERLPAALSSVLAGVLFWIVARKETQRARIIGLILFLALPLQFRYALEARGYSMGLACSLLTLLLFQALSERPSARRSLLYCASIVIGLYAHPFTCFPVAAQALWTCWPGRAQRLRFAVVASAAVGAAAFIPWRLLQMRAVAQWDPWDYFFSISQVKPTALLHDLVGGGYVCSIAILVLCAIGARASRAGTSLLLSIAAVSILGPILADAAFSYFFANRQLLFAMPALALLAARGADVLLEARRPSPVWAVVLLCAFLAASAAADFRYATVPRDDLAAGARELAARIPEGACFLTAPPHVAAQYVFLRSELRNRVCADTPAQHEVYAVINQYTRPKDRERLAQRLGGRYRLAQSVRMGRTEFQQYESAGQ